jgi:hypothetical protein
MRRETCHNRLTQYAKVAQETSHFRGCYSRINDQHAVSTLYDHGVVLEYLTLVDQYSLCDFPQHGDPLVYGSQPLDETVATCGHGILSHIALTQCSPGLARSGTEPNRLSSVWDLIAEQGRLALDALAALQGFAKT